MHFSKCNLCPFFFLFKYEYENEEVFWTCLLGDMAAFSGTEESMDEREAFAE